MLKSVIFDAYGTLISTGTGSLDAAQKILELNQRPDIPAPDFYNDWKKYHRLHIDSLNSFVSEKTIFHMDLNRLYKKYGLHRTADIDVQIMLETLENRAAFPETKAVLEALKEKYIICIASTTDTIPLVRNLQQNELTVDRIFTSESLGIYKPQAMFYEKILNELEIDVSEALFVGDSPLDDVYGPKRIGIKSCWINRRKTDFSGQIYPDFEISNLKELYEIVGLF